ncbi:T9SS type A sorting domain-containing protein [Bacteroidota bacterium]
MTYKQIIFILYLAFSPHHFVFAQNAEIFELIAEYDNNLLCNWLDVQDDLAYITTLNGLSVINIADPYNPLFVGNLATGGSWQIDVENDYAYFLSGGVKFVNIAQPGNYNLLLTYPNSNYTNLKARNNYLYLTKLHEGFDIIDVTDPNNPDKIFDFNEPGIYSEEWVGYSHIDASDNYLYVAESENEILIFDIANINNPQKIASIPTTQFITDLVVDDNLLFIGTFDYLKIYDISDPHNPSAISAINEVNRPTHINVKNGIMVFYDDDIYRYYAIDISNPAAPVILGHFDTLSHGINFDGDYIYAVGTTLKIYKLHLTTDVENNYNLPEQFLLYQNYPNPFNPSTTIEYSIPSESNVSLKVYDIIGNEVATLVDRIQSTGYYSIEFSASGADRNSLSSGIYFYSIKAGSYSVTNKMILLN